MVIDPVTTVGTMVGNIVVGNIVGKTVGNIVGTTVGTTVGDIVGIMVGNPVGDIVGTTVGNIVGKPVGDIVGTAVGTIVGAIVGHNNVHVEFTPGVSWHIKQSLSLGKLHECPFVVNKGVHIDIVSSNGLASVLTLNVVPVVVNDARFIANILT